MLWQYYAFMGLMITTLVLWAIIAIRDDGYSEDDQTSAKTEQPPSSEKEDETQP
jgi:hypothetical protein